MATDTSYTRTADDQTFDTRPPLDYRTLRKVAEWASGVRSDNTTWFVVSEPAANGNGPEANGGGHSDWFHITSHPNDPRKTMEPEQLQQSVVIPTRMGDNRESIGLAQIGPCRPNATPVDLLGSNRADSVFWTISAVEKFLVPYYASASGSQAAEVIKTVYGLLGSTIQRKAAAGQPGSITAEAEPGTDPNTGVVYALVHLPQSEYVAKYDELAVKAESMGCPLDLAVVHDHPDAPSLLYAVELYESFTVTYPDPTASGRADPGAGTP